MRATTTCARFGCNFAPRGPSSSQTVAMFRSNCTLAAILAAVLPAGCFIDGGVEDGDETATTGETAGETGSGSTGPQITAGTITQSTTNTTTGVSATGTDATSSSTQDTTVSESGPTTVTATESDTGTDTDTGGSSTTDDNTLLVGELGPGDLIITEVMANPNCIGDNCEWFELYNATEFNIDLLNLGIGDRGDFENGTPSAFILVSAILPPGELGAIARQELWPYEGIEPLARYSNAVQLSNGVFEQVAVFSGNVVLDVSATFLPNSEAGRSRVLLNEFWVGLDHTDSDDWCWSNTLLPSMSTSDDWGTPGSDVVECLPPA